MRIHGRELVLVATAPESAVDWTNSPRCSKTWDQNKVRSCSCAFSRFRTLKTPDSNRHYGCGHNLTGAELIREARRVPGLPVVRDGVIPRVRRVATNAVMPVQPGRLTSR